MATCGTCGGAGGWREHRDGSKRWVTCGACGGSGKK